MFPRGTLALALVALSGLQIASSETFLSSRASQIHANGAQRVARVSDTNSTARSSDGLKLERKRVRAAQGHANKTVGGGEWAVFLVQAPIKGDWNLASMAWHSEVSFVYNPDGWEVLRSRSRSISWFKAPSVGFDFTPYCDQPAYAWLPSVTISFGPVFETNGAASPRPGSGEQILYAPFGVKELLGIPGDSSKLKKTFIKVVNPDTDFQGISVGGLERGGKIRDRPPSFHEGGHSPWVESHNITAPSEYSSTGQGAWNLQGGPTQWILRIKEAFNQAKDQWQGRQYNLLTHNCNGHSATLLRSVLDLDDTNSTMWGPPQAYFFSHLCGEATMSGPARWDPKGWKIPDRERRYGIPDDLIAPTEASMQAIFGLAMAAATPRNLWEALKLHYNA